MCNIEDVGIVKEEALELVFDKGGVEDGDKDDDEGVYIEGESFIGDARDIDRFWIMDNLDDINIINEHSMILDFLLSLFYF